MRDPRVDPKPGDVLQKHGMVAKVTLVGRKIHYELTQGGGPIYAMPMLCWSGKPAWRTWASDAEVIHAEWFESAD